MIHRCSCASRFQDQAYGPGLRVFTVGKKDSTCTVCGAKGPLTSSMTPAKKGKEAKSRTP